MAPPHASNPLIFCRDLDSSNGTYFKSRRLNKGESVLLGHGDYLDFKHAGRIYLLQFDVSMANLEKVMDGNGELSGLEKMFQIQRRVIGEGGQAKASPSVTVRGVMILDFVGSESSYERTSRM